MKNEAWEVDETKNIRNVIKYLHLVKSEEVSICQFPFDEKTSKAETIFF